jgi:diguanylate cyclase (GGDEF)-like protein
MSIPHPQHPPIHPTPDIEADEFLEPAKLFTAGPWVLMGVGALLSLSVLIASLWRIEVGRQGAYEQAFKFSAATAAAVADSTAHVLARLGQASTALENLAAAGAPASAAADLVAGGFGLRGSGIRAILLGRNGEWLADSEGSPPGDVLLMQARAAAAAPAHPGWTVEAAALPDNGRRGPLPVVHRLPWQGGALAVVYLVDTGLLARVFDSALADRSGWMQLHDAKGRKLLDVPHGNTLPATSQHAARSVEQAMLTPLAYDSRRLLVASALSASGLFRVDVGLTETEVLSELRRRVAATWVIFGVSMTVVLSLVTVTSVALRKFARKEAYLRRLATVDLLTGLPNRRRFHQLLAKAVQLSQRRGQPLGLMFVDLDNFKDINDAMGHEAGDALLQHVGQVLSRAVRDGDRVCRLGGDEFTVLLADLADCEEAARIGERILQGLRAPLKLRGMEVTGRGSIGIALMPQHASTASDLMRFADTAMYRAKQGGRGLCVVYDGSMEAQALARAQTTAELAHAIEAGELFLVYQPKFNLRTGEMTGLEALVRWQHPARGVVYPGQFITLAEQAGLIVGLGNWVMARAIAQLAEWHAETGQWTKVAVNVSALQLCDSSLPERLLLWLQVAGVPASSLQIELTESTFAADTGLAQALVRRIRSIGVAIAVDDFGTGFSSLGVIRKFELDCLKIDRSFVTDLGHPAGIEVCRAVVSLGQAMNMLIVAEGVEEPQQRDVLRALGCDEVQGYLYARPMPAAAVLAFARQWQRQPGNAMLPPARLAMSAGRAATAADLAALDAADDGPFAVTTRAGL